MKLLLVNPYFDGGCIIPSLGLGFIATYVKEHSDCEVEVIEPTLQHISEDEVLLKAKQSDYVALTCYTESRFQVFDFAKKVKDVNPNCKIIVGGAHVNSLDELILQYYSWVDIIVCGEGEQAILDIVDDKSLLNIKNITWRNGDNIVKNPTSSYVYKKNIDKFKYDYSLVYHQISHWKDLEVPLDIQKLNAIPIIASRGCPYRCNFCASHEIWNKQFRTLTVHELVDRIKYLIDTYNIGYFRFYDAIFLGSESKIDEFCDLIKQSNIKISFRIDIKVGTSRNSLEKLKKAGCDVVGFGVESGSDKILKRLNKGITRKQIEETISICKELDFWMIGFFMISLPDETIEDIYKTFELLKYFDEINVQFFKVHPNTEFYNELKSQCIISDDIWFESKNDNEFFWCKENFSQAIFYKKDIDLLLQYSTFYHIVNHPHVLINKHGVIKGRLIYPISYTIYLLLSFELGKELLWRLKEIGVLKQLYLKLIRG